MRKIGFRSGPSEINSISLHNAIKSIYLFFSHAPATNCDSFGPSLILALLHRASKAYKDASESLFHRYSSCGCAGGLDPCPLFVSLEPATPCRAHRYCRFTGGIPGRVAQQLFYLGQKEPALLRMSCVYLCQVVARHHALPQIQTRLLGTRVEDLATLFQF